MQKTITYEHPLNERIRMFLRLELLFQQVRYTLQGSSPWDSRFTITGLMDILEVFSRSDLKTEMIKELERHEAGLERLSTYPGVDQTRLNAILNRLDELGNQLHALGGQLGQVLRDDDFLSAIRQRSSIPGGTCAFDLPAYHRWLQQPADTRIAEQERWFATLDPIRNTVELVLKLIRSSTEATTETAEGGLYQKTLDAASPCQMVRIILPAEAPYFAEVSGSKHRFSVRFMLPQNLERSTQCNEDIRFQLSCCVI